LAKQKFEETYKFSACGLLNLGDMTITVENDDITIVKSIKDIFSKVDGEVIKLSISKVEELED
jgi:hypothetical protein